VKVAPESGWAAMVGEDSTVLGLDIMGSSNIILHWDGVQQEALFLFYQELPRSS
jgi:hypothetical protein